MKYKDIFFDRDYTTDEGINKPFKIYDLSQRLLNELAFSFEQYIISLKNYYILFICQIFYLF